MAVTAAKSGFGTLLKIEVTAVFQTIEELTSVGGPEAKLDTADATNMESPNTFREKVATLLDGGTVSFEGNWTKSTYQVALMTNMNARTLSNFKLTLSNSLGEWAFSGYITAFGISAAIDGIQKYSGQITLSGKPSLT